MTQRIFKNNKETKYLVFNIAGTFFIKGGAIIISLFTTPAYMRYFNHQTILGLWFTLLSVLNWVLSFDLGIGNGLRNKLTETLVYKDFIKAQKYISSAYIILGSFSFCLCGLSFLIFPYINWNNIFNVSKNVICSSLLINCIEIVFCGLMIQFTLRLITSILYSLQKSALTNLLSLISSVIILIYVLLAPNHGLRVNLLTMAWINVLAVNLPLLIATILIFRTTLKDSCPNIKQYNNQYALSVLKIGVVFFCLQFMSMMIGNTNEFLISKFTFPKYVVDYQVYYKIFNMFNALFSLAFIPVWSAATKQFALKNYGWLKSMHKFLLLNSLIGTILLFVMVPFIPYIIKIWIGDAASIGVNWKYGCYFAICTGLMILNGANCCIANGLGWLKIQSIFLTIGALINIPLAFILVKLTNAWISIVVANIISLLPICIIQPIYIQNKLKNKIQQKEDIKSVFPSSSK